MAKIAIGYRDRVQEATISATSERAGLPASNVATAQPSQIWRTVGGVTTAQLLIDFGAAVSIGYVYVGNTNMSQTGTLRIRLSAASNLSSPLYDSTALDAGVEAEYRCTFRTFTAVSARYLGLDFADAALSYLDVGRVMAGPCFRPEYNFAYGAKREHGDASVRTISENGNDYILRGVYRRGISFTLPAITTAEWEAHGEPMLRLNGSHLDVVVCLDPGASNIGRDTFAGLLEELPAWEMNFPGHNTASFRLMHRV
jgi:hypothetical protein